MAKLVASNTWTDAELLALYREALVELSVAQSTTLRGKTVTRASIPHIREMVEWLENRIDKSSGFSGIVHSKHARR